MRVKNIGSVASYETCVRAALLPATNAHQYGRYASALSTCCEVVSLFPGNGDALRFRALLSAKLGLDEECIKFCEMIIDGGLRSSEVWILYFSTVIRSHGLASVAFDRLTSSVKSGEIDIEILCLILGVISTASDRKNNMEYAPTDCQAPDHMTLLMRSIVDAGWIECVIAYNQATQGLNFKNYPRLVSCAPNCLEPDIARRSEIALFWIKSGQKNQLLQRRFYGNLDTIRRRLFAVKESNLTGSEWLAVGILLKECDLHNFGDRCLVQSINQGNTTAITYSAFGLLPSLSFLEAFGKFQMLRRFDNSAPTLEFGYLLGRVLGIGEGFSTQEIVGNSFTALDKDYFADAQIDEVILSGEFEAVVSALEADIARSPDSVAKLVKLVYFYRQRGKFLEATNSHERVVGKYSVPTSSPYKWLNIAFSYFAVGLCSRGWESYGRRFESNPQLVYRYRNIPRWTGESLHSKSIVLWCEQGVADEIWFSSLIPDLIGTGASIAMECDRRLVALLTRSFPGVYFFSRGIDEVGTNNGIFDFQISILDLGMYFRRSISDFIGHPRNFIAAAPLSVDISVPELRNLSRRINVGISWRSVISRWQKIGGDYPCIRSMASLLRHDGVNWINLQCDATSVELETFAMLSGNRLVVPRVPDLYNDIEAQAALIANLDLVISPCTLTGVLAASIGVQTAFFWSESSDIEWRLLGEASLPWYPEATLFKKGFGQSWLDVSSRLYEYINAMTVGRNDVASLPFTAIDVPLLDRHDIEVGNEQALVEVNIAGHRLLSELLAELSLNSLACSRPAAV